ncbi:phosphoglyceromutase [Rhodococcus sp. 06-156-3C]|uniref:2,3-bisphosphoglycerate-dependent phosphoglycerate mutase n=1 Tax=Nocardiaceae TaxID=85025 RepID=UPI000523083A
MSAGTLVLLRHAQSVGNARNRFAGWSDIALTEKGRLGAMNAGLLLASSDVLPDVVHTSLLRRAIDTASIALDAADRHWIPAQRSWRLNERHYGALQGRDRDGAAAEWGAHQVRMWRRSFRARPPSLPGEGARQQLSGYRYAGIADVPNGESLADVHERVVPYYLDEIIPDLDAGRTVLVVSHGNTLRALLKHLDEISDDQIDTVEVPIGRPLRYRFDDALCPIVTGGVYL